MEYASDRGQGRKKTVLSHMNAIPNWDILGQRFVKMQTVTKLSIQNSPNIKIKLKLKCVISTPLVSHNRVIAEITTWGWWGFTNKQFSVSVF